MPYLVIEMHGGPQYSSVVNDGTCGHKSNVFPTREAAQAEADQSQSAIVVPVGSDIPSPPKVLIEVRGGKIQCVGSNDPALTYVVVDWDNVDQGESPVSEILSPDFTPSGNDRDMRDMFTAPDEQEVHDELKRIHF